MTVFADVRVRYHWQEGSVPPPHYYEYTIELGPASRGRVIYLPGYAFEEPPAWKVDFAVEEDAWRQFVAMVNAEGFMEYAPPSTDPPPVGGSIHTLEVRTFRQEITFRSFGRPEGLVHRAVSAVRALVPETVWEELETRHAAYREATD